MPVTVSQPHFEGPLDLLLHLIERRELDISAVSLAAVTDDFLRTIRELPQADPDTIAEFLVVAAKLLLIKSSLLLPRSVPEVEEESGEELARTLELYRQYKQVAQLLAVREAAGTRAYARVAPPPELERRLQPDGTSVAELFAALRRVLRERPPEPEPVDQVVRPLRISVRQRITELTVQLRRGEPLPFAALLSEQPSRQEVIATFLAMLELLKLGWTRAEQSSLWGEIALWPVAEALPNQEGDAPPAEIDEYI